MSYEIIYKHLDVLKGSVFVTKPNKLIQTIYKYENAIELIEHNDPYSLINEYLHKQNDEFITVFTNGSTVFQSLPVLSLDNFKNHKVINHIDLSTFDFSIVTSLRDLNAPVLISQNSKDLNTNTKVAYNLANKLHSSVYHFILPFSTTNVINVNTLDFLLSQEDLDKLEIEEVLYKFDTLPFEVLNLSKLSNPKDVVVYLGLINEDLVRAFTKANVLVVSINLYKPFKLPYLLGILPATIETLTLVQQTTTASTGHFSPLLLDFFQDYATYQGLKNFTKVVSGYVGYNSDIDVVIKDLIANTRLETPAQNLVFGQIGVEVTTELEQANKTQADSDLQKVLQWESQYLEILKQINGHVEILNEYNSDKISTSPEFGYGKFLQWQHKLEKLTGLVYQAINDKKFNALNNSKVLEILTAWLNGKSSEQDVLKLIEYLESDKSSISQQLLEFKDILPSKNNSHWLIGSDAWAYDLGSSGVHNLISNGSNINMLIIDNEPYGSKRKEIDGNRKKDVGLYAMNYGNCYVASVAIYSSYTQVLQAFIEAEKFPGPSVVLGYLPYHSELDSTLDILTQTKKAVDVGYWPLYRYNPLLDDEKLKFKLDSSMIKNALKEFLDRENKLTLLTTKDPELSRNLVNTGISEITLKQRKRANEAYEKLLTGLSGPPLTIAYATDGGNALNVAKKINRQASGRGLKSQVVSLDDITMEDLPNEVNLVVIVSTTGQGEIPLNGKLFWESFKNESGLDLSSVKFSVFGMGDSEYWPRKEDAHFYNKPAKDLYTKFKLYGAAELAELGLGDDQGADGFNTGLNEWLPKIWKALGVDGIDGVEEPKPLTNEDMKLQSNYLRGTIAEGLQDNSTGSISAVDQQLTKFHGIYMQDDRDVREERKIEGIEPAYAFMVRLRLPGGKATPQQYLKLNELADVKGNGTLKLTTRATFQLHGVVKHKLRSTIRGMNSVLLDTLAACGDVNRNVMVSALPHNAKVQKQVSDIGAKISSHLLPKTTAYHEIWLEGNDANDKPGFTEAFEARNFGPKKRKTLVSGDALVDHEPLYGPTYLPRKFKVVITVPPYNDVDVYAHDIGLIAIVVDNEVIGFNMLAGGGMGSTHNNKKTYPRLGSMLGFVTKEEVHIACEKVMLVQRDFGDRTNRKHARLKYTVDDLGVDVFKAKVEELLGHEFGEPRPFEITSNIDYFGWCKDETGLNHFTAFIENGRIEDTTKLPQKSGLKKIAQYLINKSGEFRLTGNQHLLISNIRDEDLMNVKALMKQYKLDNTNFSGLRLSSAACVAFPTCGLAFAESERYLPELITKLEESLEEYGLRHDSIVMRMTGCANGCARPWVAEVALVGKAYGAYNLMIGGGYHGERLNKIYRYSVKEDEILDILKPLFKRWSLERLDKEHFGDFVIRTGIIKPTLEGKHFHEDIPVDA